MMKNLLVCVLLLGTFPVESSDRYRSGCPFLKGLKAKFFGAIRGLDSCLSNNASKSSKRPGNPLSDGLFTILAHLSADESEKIKRRNSTGPLNYCPYTQAVEVQPSTDPYGTVCLCGEDQEGSSERPDVGKYRNLSLDLSTVSKWARVSHSRATNTPTRQCSFSPLGGVRGHGFRELTEEIERLGTILEGGTDKQTNDFISYQDKSGKIHRVDVMKSLQKGWIVEVGEKPTEPWY